MTRSRRQFIAWLLTAFTMTFSLGLTMSAASADTVDIRNPLDTAANINSNWNHPASATPPYSERSLDIVPNSGAAGGAWVGSRVDNLNSTKKIYYDSFNYGGSCTGVKHVMYENPVGTSDYNYIGTVVYVHLQGHTTSWYSTIINASSSEYRGIWYIYNGTQCGSTGAHLHHGRVTDGAALGDAYRLTTSGSAPQLSSSEITLYK